MSNLEKIEAVKSCLSTIKNFISNDVDKHNEVLKEKSKMVNIIAKASLFMSAFAVLSFILLLSNVVFLSGELAPLFMIFTLSFSILMIVSLSSSYNINNKIEDEKLNIENIFKYFEDGCFYDLDDKNNIFLNKIILPKEIYFSIYQKLKDIMGEEDFKFNIEYPISHSKIEDIGNAYLVKMVIFECIDYLYEGEYKDDEGEEFVNKVKEKSLNTLYSNLE